ncbi:MAG: hypothetical protein HS111_01760 [Kofleriaceae bacterium]|nr:hypothetical protein [Kofleriaceae bacterium]
MIAAPTPDRGGVRAAVRGTALLGAIGGHPGGPRRWSGLALALGAASLATIGARRRRRPRHQGTGARTRWRRPMVAVAALW